MPSVPAVDHIANAVAYNPKSLVEEPSKHWKQPVLPELESGHSSRRMERAHSVCLETAQEAEGEA